MTSLSAVTKVLMAKYNIQKTADKLTFRKMSLFTFHVWEACALALLSCNFRSLASNYTKKRNQPKGETIWVIYDFAKDDLEV